jgi:RNAse (barnase) inhibitor barstar
MSKINNRQSYYSTNNIRFVFLDGAANDTLGKCFNTLQNQLSIPDYFGHNLDALEEVLADLEWVEEQSIHLVIYNKNALLQQEVEKKELFLDILNTCENERLEIFYIETPHSLT